MMNTVFLSALSAVSAQDEAYGRAPHVPIGPGPLDTKCEDETFVQNCVQQYVDAGMCYLKLPNIDNFDVDSILAQFPTDCYDCPNIGPLADEECGALGLSQETLDELEAYAQLEEEGFDMPDDDRRRFNWGPGFSIAKAVTHAAGGNSIAAAVTAAAVSSAKAETGSTVKKALGHPADKTIANAVTTESSSYTRLIQACVYGNNMKRHADKTFKQCAELCDREDKCLAFEFGMNYGGKKGNYKYGDCQLQSSASFEGCPGKDYNLDLWIKEKKDTSTAKTSGCSVTLYQHEGFKGSSVTFTKDAGSLSTSFDNQASSLKVKGEGCIATLFQNSNHGGWSAQYPTGDYDYPAMMKRGAKNDQVSSVKLTKLSDSPSTEIECSVDYEENVDYVGNTLRTVANVESLYKCAKICGKEPLCKSWTYCKKGGCNKTCVLKKEEKANRRVDNRADSGLPCKILDMVITVDDEDIEEKIRNMTPEQKETVNKFQSLIDDIMSGNPFEEEFCWRDAYGRTAGEIGSDCPPGKERVGIIGLFCYDLCPKGWYRIRDANGRALFDQCNQECPKGWTEIPFACTIDGHIGHSYWRQEYPWKFGDWIASDDGMIRRCEADHGKGNCEKIGWMFYPKCKGNLPLGVRWNGILNWCRPTVDCGSIDMHAGFQITGRTCSKQAPKFWPGIRHTDCREGTVRDGALCYPKCKDGYHGVGPVCWGQPPNGWVKCGMGAARNDGTCASVIAGQVMGPVTLAITIGTFGASALGSSAAQSPWIIQQAKDLIDMLKEATPLTRELLSIFFTFLNVKGAMDHRLFKTDEDIVRFVAKIARIFDHTGVSSTIASYTYPTCDKYFGSKSGGGRRMELKKLAPVPQYEADVEDEEPLQLSL